MGNEKRNFLRRVCDMLGKYVYVLRDPRDNKIFYVGQGTGNRVFDHFNEAENFQKDNKPLDRKLQRKLQRIIDIWDSGQDVDWFIVAHNLSEEEANCVESAVYNILGKSLNGELSNTNKTPRSTLLLPDDIKKMETDIFNPTEPIATLFIFPIHNSLKEKGDIYNATRGRWKVGNTYRNKKPAYAVGVKEFMSEGAFKIKEWQKTEDNKYEFNCYEKKELDKNEKSLLDQMTNKYFYPIIKKAEGYWNRGNFLVVSFDGMGHFRFVRGYEDKDTWYNLKEQEE